MFRFNLTLIVLILIVFDIQSQVVGQDKEGFSSIIQPSSTFNLDLTDKVASLNYYQESLVRGFRDSVYDSEEKCNAMSNDIEEYRRKLFDSWNRIISLGKSVWYMGVS